MAVGAASHGLYNYRSGKGDPEFLRDRINHLIGHALKLAAGDTSEDHLGAVLANANIVSYLIDAEPSTSVLESRTSVQESAAFSINERPAHDELYGLAEPCTKQCGRLSYPPGVCLPCQRKKRR
jgi:hypothetical protein